MKEAIALALKGKGFVNPNPAVGAVIVKNGKIIGRGYHQFFGQAHAERNAIFDAIKNCNDENACKQATLFVTLEPCCHQGKQPPCTQIIIESGISEVYIGSCDPNPPVNGQGVRILREHNIIVHEKVLKSECDAINPFFFHFIKNKTPFVILKYAMSLNGTSKIKKGNKQISCDMSLADVHKTRSEVMGVLVSYKTVNDDNCLLTNRFSKNTHQSARIILDKNLKIKKNARILQTAQVSPIIIFYHTNKIWKIRFLKKCNVELIKMPLLHGHLDLETVLKILGNRNFDSILVESSGKLAESFMAKNLVNKLQVYVGSNFISKNFRKEICVKPILNQISNDTVIEFSDNVRGKLCSQE